MSEERLTPEERAVITAAEKWRDSPALVGRLADVLISVVDALRESRKRWRVEARNPCRIVGPQHTVVLVGTEDMGAFKPDAFRTGVVLDLLNAADKEQP